jgi:hypothetical protein
MKGSDLIQIAASVYGIKWFDSLMQEVGISDKELSALSKQEDELPGPIQFALREIATKYMARVESMQVNTNVRDALLNGTASDKEQAAYMAGIVKGMTLVLKAIHGEPQELKALAKDKNFESVE